jgi:predicted ArsR family transcriptional regulator
MPQQVPRMSPPQVLERIERARVAQQKAETELAALVDHAVELGIGWPQIAAQLGVTRQAARQHYQRRHRDGAVRQDGSV